MMKTQVEHLVEEGLDSARRGDIERAEAQFREALRWSPDNADALFSLAVLHYVGNDLDGALDLLSQCIAADPLLPKSHYQRGMVQYARGDLIAALADFDCELRSQPDDVEAILSRGATLVALDNKSEALASYQRAIKLAPEDARPYYNRGILRAEADPDGAIADFTAAINRDPLKAEAYMGRGCVFRLKGRKSEALADFRTCLQLDGPQLHGNEPLVERWIKELEREIGGAVLETPLSDLMSDWIASQTQDSFARFLDAFQHARVGVVAYGIPQGTMGEVTSTAEHPVSLASTIDPDGHPRILAFADPPAFARNYGAKFNAEMSGTAVLEAILLNPCCCGLQVNSATAEMSILVDRDTVASLLGRKPSLRTSSRQPWWKVW
ncbi:MAG: tetratricopeptide repeat protein [Anaerolineae bacterium]